jgi:uncharacterized protein YndB with AHSA1/START domain
VTALTVRRRIATPVERVWEAWTSPSALRQWWGPPGVRCIAAEVELRPGGRYRLGNRLADGAVVWIDGVFEVVDAPRRLVYTWQIGDEPMSRVTVELAAIEGGTEIVVHHEQIATDAQRDDHARGWAGCLDGLAAWIASA